VSWQRIGWHLSRRVEHQQQRMRTATMECLVRGQVAQGHGSFCQKVAENRCSWVAKATEAAANSEQPTSGQLSASAIVLNFFIVTSLDLFQMTFLPLHPSAWAYPV